MTTRREIQPSPIRNHEGQLKVWKDKARFKVVVCGRRWGKTTLAIEWLLAGSCVPNTRHVYIAPTLGQARDICWDHIKNRIRRDLHWRTTVSETHLCIYRTNGSKIYIRSAEKPERFRGQKYNRIVLDEFAEYRGDSIWYQVLRPTLADTRGKAIFIFTPKGVSSHGYNLYQKARTEKGWASFTFKTIDSPFFQTPDGLAEIEAAKKELSEKDFNQEFCGGFETHSGRIYYAFDRTRINTDYTYNPDNGPIIVGQDFNRSPMASALFQKVSGKLIQFDEVFLRTADTKTTCEEIRRRYPAAEVIMRPDATGKRKTSNSALSDFDIIKSFGFAIQADGINPRVIDRWAATNAALTHDRVLINVSKCPVTVKDRETLCYKEGSCEADLKDPWAGHICDAADYAIYKEFPIILPKKSSMSYYA